MYILIKKEYLFMTDSNTKEESIIYSGDSPWRAEEELKKCLSSSDKYETYYSMSASVELIEYIIIDTDDLLVINRGGSELLKWYHKDTNMFYQLLKKFKDAEWEKWAKKLNPIYRILE